MQQNSLVKALFLGCLVTLTAGCGKEVGRLPFAAEASKSTTLQLESGDVGFWTDLDIKYDGPAALAYQIELQQGGTSVATATCNPLGQLNVKVGWIETRLGDSRSASGNGKMACSAKLPKGGATTVSSTLAFSTRPAALTLTKADLVVKQ